MDKYTLTYDAEKKSNKYEITRNVDRTLPEFLWIPLSKANLEEAVLNEAKKTKKSLRLQVTFKT